MQQTVNGQRSTVNAFTLLELMMVIMLFAILTVVTVYIFRAVLLSFSSSDERAGVGISLDRGIEELIRDLRKAKQVKSTAGYNELRFTQDENSYYIYYLYNTNDSYGPPPVFDEDSYQLKKATLTGDIDGTFTYGSGQLIISDIAPPATSELSFDGSAITIDLTIARGDEVARTKTEVVPRNL